MNSTLPNIDQIEHFMDVGYRYIGKHVFVRLLAILRYSTLLPITATGIVFLIKETPFVRGS